MVSRLNGKPLYYAGTVRVNMPGSSGTTFHGPADSPDACISSMYEYAASYRAIYGYSAVEILIPSDPFS